MALSPKIRQPLILVLAALCVVLPARARAEADPCAKIRFGFHESIAPQGFLGLATPKTDVTAVRDAFHADVNAYKELVAHPDDRDREGQPSFDLSRVCQLALSQGHSVLWVGCHGDTYVEDGEYFADSLRQGSRNIEQVNATCVISTYDKSKNPKWDDLMKTALIRSGSDRFSIFPGAMEQEGNRHKQLANRDRRLELYRNALERSVEMYMYDHRNDAPPVDPDAAHCP